MSYRARIAPIAAGRHRPRWSVMIPTFNCAGYLAETLRGVLAQDPGRGEMQIEVVDDGSTDDPLAVVRDVGGDRVSFFRQASNVGHIRNFETCLARSRGHLVHLLHGDDFVLPGFYSALERGFEHDGSIGAAFCRWRIVDERGSTLSVAEPRRDRPGPLDNPVVTLAEEQHIVTPSIAVRRSVYERLGGFDDRLACAEDWEMWVRIAASFGVWYEPLMLAAYRTHADSNTGRHARLAQELRYTADVIEMFPDYVPPAEVRDVMRTARRAYAATALHQARHYANGGDPAAVRAHLRAAFRLSRSPGVIANAVKLLPKAFR